MTGWSRNRRRTCPSNGEREIGWGTHGKVVRLRLITCSLTGQPTSYPLAKAGAAPGTTGGVEQGNSRSYITQPSFLRRSSPQTLHSRSYTYPRHPFLTAFKPAVCPPSNPPTPPAAFPVGLSKATSNNSRSYMPQPSVFNGLQACHLPTFKRSKPFPAGLSKATSNNSRSSMPQPSVFKGVQLSNPPNPHPPAGLSEATSNNSRSYMPQLPVFKGVQACPLPAFKRSKPSKPSRRPFQGNWQQLSQLHAPAICF